MPSQSDALNIASSQPDARVTDDRCAQHSGAVNQPCLTPEQFAVLRYRMAQNRQPVERSPWSNYDYPRGWNGAFDFIEKTLKELTGATPS